MPPQMLSTLARLAPDPGICPPPSRDWLPIWEYALHRRMRGQRMSQSVSQSVSQSPGLDSERTVTCGLGVLRRRYYHMFSLPFRDWCPLR
eukprot:1182534-Pyramimonas_sp.AAC.1